MIISIVAPSAKKSLPEYPIHELIAERWSPYGFSPRPVLAADLHALFEAARWAASSYNEQPWSYFVALKTNKEEFQRLLSCLVPGNQAWAQSVPVLALGVVSLKFAKNGKDNRAAVHDLGLATANLVFEAGWRGLCVHQMIGIVPERARELYQIPEHAEAWTALAIGYSGSGDELPEELRKKDAARRARKPVGEFVFTGSWGKSAVLE